MPRHPHTFFHKLQVSKSRKIILNNLQTQIISIRAIFANLCRDLTRNDSCQTVMACRIQSWVIKICLCRGDEPSFLQLCQCRVESAFQFGAMSRATWTNGSSCDSKKNCTRVLSEPLMNQASLYDSRLSNRVKTQRLELSHEHCYSFCNWKESYFNVLTNIVKKIKISNFMIIIQIS